MGRDLRRAALCRARGISIHAPRVGRDSSNFALINSPPLFQSTRPVWGATTLAPVAVSVTIFQSTRPVWGATTFPPSCRSLLIHISIHAPRVGRDNHKSAWNRQYPEFQSTRPVWGATRFAPLPLADTLFQSTRPVWGATPGAVIVRVASNISIHAPRVGRDRAAFARLTVCAYFNPRAPCGARRT